MTASVRQLMGKTPEYLYRIQPARPGMLTEGPTAEEQQVLSEHFEYLKGLTDAGVVLLAGRTLNADSTCFGIVIFRASSEEEALRLMNGDPAVARGVMRADLFPYSVALLGSTPWPPA